MGHGIKHLLHVKEDDTDLIPIFKSCEPVLHNWNKSAGGWTMVHETPLVFWYRIGFTDTVENFLQLLGCFDYDVT